MNSLKKYFFASFSMLEKILETCPDELWNKKAAGFVFWQQLLHTLGGIHYWLREENTEFIEPFKAQNVYPERMEKDPENILSKDVLKQYCKETNRCMMVFCSVCQCPAASGAVLTSSD